MFNAWTLNGPTVPATAVGSIRAALVATLKASPAVIAVVGAEVHPGAVPQTVATAAVAYQLVSTTRERGTGGANGISRAWFQISCVAPLRSEGEALAQAVRDLFDGLTWSAERFDGAKVETTEQEAAILAAFSEFLGSLKR